jgi:hypothetical protein
MSAFRKQRASTPAFGLQGFAHIQRRGNLLQAVEIVVESTCQGRWTLPAHNVGRNNAIKEIIYECNG